MKRQRRPIIGVMGAGDHATETAMRHAYTLGTLIAQKGWILLNGGRNAGVMEASAHGAKEAGGLIVGILPDADRHRASEYLDIPIVTGLGSGRNTINVLSSDVIIACQGGAGTLSEIALAVKAGKPVILLDFEDASLFRGEAGDRLMKVKTPEEAVELVTTILTHQQESQSLT
ncbi:TIGR00725 family protein [candidate division KSB3 bacterium]|uniref:TIGR00725 family protein n=1 Tax=candidate division KSB3 bacterium TaxID=2044937 RepID=A0A9D5JX96_9BACT|nr:TIGR00725 family protein [candidate division KSB3 bacterium]MBD3325833.1 TIGR00725 family protein [candidate division KSB3 bacterium]